jgi:cell wall-associated NlpC family hydrolase
VAGVPVVSAAPPASGVVWPDAPGSGGSAAPGVGAGGVVASGSSGGVAGAVGVSGAGVVPGAVGVVGSGVVAPVGLQGLLGAPGLSVSAPVRAWLASGQADPRVVSVLDSVLAHHSVGVSGVVSESSPVHVQSLEIVSVDGQPVGPDNFAARDLVTEIAALDPSVRPDEIGTPWPIQSPGFFSDSGSQGSLHLAFEMPGTNAGVSEPAAGVVPGAASVGSAASYGTPGAVAGAASTVPGAANSAVPAPAGSVPNYAASSPAAVPATTTPAVAGTPAPGSGVAGQVQQVAGAGAPLPLDSSVDPSATAKVAEMTKFADSVLGKPYIYGGGHGTWGPQPGYDCSGFVSAVLHAGGYLHAPVDTTLLPSQAGIVAGPGKVVTIFDRALPGQNGHVIIEINGQFYESGGRAGPWGGGGGVMKIGKPSADYLAAFPNVLHPEGL